MAEPTSVNSLLAEALAWDNPGQPAQGPTFRGPPIENPAVPRMQRNGRMTTASPDPDPNGAGLIPAPTETLAPVTIDPAAPGSPQRSAQRSADVANAAAGITQELSYRSAVSRYTGVAPGDQPQALRDANTMSPRELRETYGRRQAFEIMAARNSGNRAYVNDATGSRTPGQELTDSAVDVAGGFATGLAGLGALVLGVADSDAGAWGARQVQNLSEFARSQQSPALQGRQRIGDARSELNSEQNEATRLREVGTHGELVAGLRSIGRGAVNELGTITSDGMTFTSATGQAVGSLLTGGVIARGISALGRVLGSSVRSSIAMPTAIGLLEGGGAYSGTSSEVQGMSFESLERTSPIYRELLKPVSEGGLGLTPEQARTRLAGEAGLTAAAIQAPLGAATGMLVSRFEASPFRVPSVRTAAGNLMRETLEEGAQSGSGQMAQNYAIQGTADETRSLAQGVGEGITEGAVFGLGAAGAVQAPGAARATVRAAGRGVLGAAESVTDARRAANEASAPAVGTIDGAPATSDIETSDVNSTPGDRSVIQITPQNDSEITVPARNESEAQTQTTAPVVPVIPQAESTNEATPEMVELARRAPVGERNGQNELSLDGLIARSKSKGATAEAIRGGLDRFIKVRQAEHGSVFIDNADGSVSEIVGQVSGNWVDRQGNPVDLTVLVPDNLETTAEVIQRASDRPGSGELKAAKAVLQQATQGKIKLTMPQFAALRSHISMIEANDQYINSLKASGQKFDGGDVKDVGAQVLVNRIAKRRKLDSALVHAERAIRAGAKGELESATKQAVALSRFIESQNNKLNGINDHFEKGGAWREYQAWNPEAGKFYPSSNTNTLAGVTPHRVESLTTVQNVHHETQHLAALYEGIRTAFPELKLAQIAPVSLDPQLLGNAEELSKQFAAKRDAKLTQRAPTALPGRVGKVTPKAEPRKEGAPALPDAINDNVTDVTELPSNEQVDDLVRQNELRQQDEALESETEIKKLEGPPDEQIEDEPEDSAEPISMDNAYPDLREGSAFKEAFKLPKEQKSRVFGSESPTAFVLKAITSIQTFKNATGSKKASRIDNNVTDAYTNLLKAAMLTLKTNMNEQLAAFWADKANQSPDYTYHRLPRGKFLNITNQDGSYNQELLEGALLASTQWLLTFKEGIGNPKADDIADMLGLEEYEAEGLVTEFRKGMHTHQLVHSLAQKIGEYWGLNPNQEEGQGLSQGILTSLAGEILRAMVSGGMLEALPPLKVPTRHNGVEGTQTFNFYKAVPLSKDSDPIKKFPTLLDEALLVSPTGNSYYGDDKVPVATHQLRNNTVPNTPEDKAQIRKANAITYLADTAMIGLYQLLGSKNLQKLFAHGTINEETTNKNHKKTLDGQNISIASAFDSISDKIDEMQRIDPEAWFDLPIHYAHNVTRVGRLQMLGAQNPQASKLAREAFVSTWSNLDLTGENQEHQDLFDLALGQALDEKIHKQDVATTKLNVAAKLIKLRPVIDMLGEMNLSNELPENAIELIQDTLNEAGVPLTPLALHALMEQARLNLLNDKSNFKTSLYIEADGVTNGIINAMMLLTTGKFTGPQLRNLAKGGVSFTDSIKTLAEQYKRDKDDMYQETTNILKGKLKENLAGVREPVIRQYKQLMSFMSLLLPDVSIKDNIEEFKRGIVKNPLTITVYGSGRDGIAGKFTSQLLEEIYARMSLMAQAEAQGLDPADTVFADVAKNPQEARKLWADFERQLNQLTEWNAYRYEGQLQIGKNKKASSFGKVNPVTFTLTPDRVETLKANLRVLFVDPMAEAIEESVGPEVIKSTTLVRRAGQTQSIFLKWIFRDALAKKLQEIEARDGFKSDFLSPKDQRDILQSLEKYAPIIHSPGQTFNVSTRDNFDAGTRFGIAGDETFATDGQISGPKNVGVSTIPFLNIGMGDGKAIQNFFKITKTDKLLAIYDGIHFSLDQVRQGSQDANQAVWESWKGNTLEAMLGSYKPFMANITADTITSDMLNELSRALYDPSELADGSPSINEIFERMQMLQQQLEVGARSIENRHKVIQEAQTHIDQMAGAFRPYTNTGKIIEGNFDEIASALNEKLVLLEAKSVPLVPLKEVPNPTKPVTAEGVKVYTGADLATEVKALPGMTGDQLSLINEVIKSLSALDYTIVTGSPEQLAAWQIAHGKKRVNLTEADKTIHGTTSTGDKVIYLVNPSSETMVHELIHASTFEKIRAHYEDGVSTPEVKAAIKRLEVLMNEFEGLGETMVGYSSNTQAAYLNTREAMNKWGTNKAAKLNEFMAWTLANKDLTSATQKVTLSKKVADLVKYTKDALANVMQVIFGGTKRPKPGQKFFDNLLFNTQIVMNAQPTASQITQDVSLQVATNYGTDPRLSRMQETFDSLFTDFLSTTDNVQYVLNDAERQQALLVASNQAMNAMTQFGFNMNQQEQALFENIVSALTANLKVDPNSLAQMESLYRQVMKSIDYTMFRKNTDPTDQNDDHQARVKLDILTGQFSKDLDSRGRSGLLPTFIALSMVNDEMRDVLTKIPLTKEIRKQDGTWDSRLENWGNIAMEKLSDHVAGGNPKSANVRIAMDALMENIQEQAQKRQHFVEQYVTTPLGSGVDKANGFVVEKLQALADGVDRRVAGLRKKTSNKYAGYLLSAAGVATALISDKSAESVSEGVMAGMNRLDGWKPLRALMRDLVGRTNTNAGVYDLTKTVRTMVQQLRQNYRENLPQTIESMFKTKLTETQSSVIFRGLGKTDLASLVGSLSKAEVLQMLVSGSKRRALVTKLEDQIRALDPNHASMILAKSEQLAEYMRNGTVGNNLLRNADAITELLNERTRSNRPSTTQELMKAIDQLTTLYALGKLNKDDRSELSSLVQNEPTGMDFALSYLVGQRKDEVAKAQGMARFNAVKGFIPSEKTQPSSLIVADNSEHVALIEKSYVRVGDYNGSPSEAGRSKKGYYFSPLNGRASYSQGIFQNVRLTAGGVDVSTGFMHDGLTAGVIANPKTVAVIQARLSMDINQSENLVPINDEHGNLVAYERSVNPVMLDRIQKSTNFANMVGVWRGRQVEERNAQIFNEALVDQLYEMYRNSSNKDEYVNLYASKDPVVQDAMKLLSKDTREYITDQFGEDRLMVRRDMIDDALGYRAASVGDMWTGNSRWSEKTQKTVKDLTMMVWGNKAYYKLVKNEERIQNLVKDAKLLIVVKSVIVPVGNFASNILQMAGRGIPMADIYRGVQRKTAEINAYTKSLVRKIELEAQLRASTDDIVGSNKLKAQIQSIEDSHRRMSIWPLIERGEFSSISDAGITKEDMLMTEGKFVSAVEGWVDRLPKSVRNAGRYAIISRDTALFQGLQKSVAYGDFIAKAITYDDLINRKKLSQEEALGRISEEFVNYDRLPGRFRGYLESMGLLWFYNFKIRSVKVAASMIRNNPVHTLLATLAPVNMIMSSVDLPTQANIMTKLADGSITYSIGPGQGFSAPMLHPLANIAY